MEEHNEGHELMFREKIRKYLYKIHGRFIYLGFAWPATCHTSCKQASKHGMRNEE
jgi:hypothetical protein